MSTQKEKKQKPKKSIKRKLESKNDAQPVKKQKLSKKEKKAILKEKKAKRKPNFQVKETMKQLWEEFRQKNKALADDIERRKYLDPKPTPEELKKMKQQDEERRKEIIELLDKIFQQAKGKMVELSHHHDASRIVQAILKHGTPEQHAAVYEELKGSWKKLCIDKYGHHIVKKLLFYAKKQRSALFEIFKGNVQYFFSKRYPASVLDYAYTDIANAQQRFDIIKEFYGSEFKLKDEKTKIKSLKEVLDESPDKKIVVLQQLQKNIQKAVDKGLIDLHIVQRLVLDLLENSNPKVVKDFIVDLRDAIVHILHTPEGARIGMFCLAYGDAKDRKTIIKSFKDNVPKIASDSQGYLVLCRTLDCVDDTELVYKTILVPLIKDGPETACNKYAHLVYLHLLSPSNKSYFQKSLLELLEIPTLMNEEGKQVPTTKKGPEKIRNELLEKWGKDLINFAKNHMEVLLEDMYGSKVFYEILKLDGEKEEIYKKLLNVVIEGDVLKNKAASRAISKLILDEVKEGKLNFAKELYEKIDAKEFVLNKKGGFIVSALMRNEEYKKELTKKLEKYLKEIEKDKSNTILVKILNDAKTENNSTKEKKKSQKEEKKQNKKQTKKQKKQSKKK